MRHGPSRLAAEDAVGWPSGRSAVGRRHRGRTGKMASPRNRNSQLIDQPEEEPSITRRPLTSQRGASVAPADICAACGGPRSDRTSASPSRSCAAAGQTVRTPTARTARRGGRSLRTRAHRVRTLSYRVQVVPRGATRQGPSSGGCSRSSRRTRRIPWTSWRDGCACCAGGERSACQPCCSICRSASSSRCGTSRRAARSTLGSSAWPRARRIGSEPS